MQRSRNYKKSFELLSRSTPPPSTPHRLLALSQSFRHKLTEILRAEDKFFPFHTTRQTGRGRPAICNLEHLIIADADAKDTADGDHVPAPSSTPACHRQQHAALRNRRRSARTQISYRYRERYLSHRYTNTYSAVNCTRPSTCLIITPTLTPLLTVPDPVPVSSLYQHLLRC